MKLPDFDYSKIYVLVTYFTQEAYKTMIVSAEKLETLMDDTYATDEEWDKLESQPHEDLYTDLISKHTEPCFIVFGATMEDTENKAFHHITLNSTFTMLYNHYDREFYEDTFTDIMSMIEDKFMELEENYENPNPKLESHPEDTFYITSNS